MFMLLAAGKECTAGVTDADLTALSDPQVTIQNNHFLLPNDYSLIAAYAFGTTISALKIDSPSLRSMYLPFIRPLDRTLLPADEPNVCDFGDFALTLRRGEEVKLLASNAGGADEKNYCLLWLGDGRRTIQTGPIYTMRATSTITTVADTWTQGNLTFDQTLPAGRYSIVGMEVAGTALLAGRLILPGYFHRPGVVASQTLGQNSGKLFRAGGLGEYGDFANTAMPSVEVLKGSAASTAVTVHLDLIYKGR